MVFDDPVGPRTAAQLTAMAETTRTFANMLVGAVDGLNGQMTVLDATFRGETDGLRQQAGAVISGMQQRASEVIGKMLEEFEVFRGLGSIG